MAAASKCYSQPASKPTSRSEWHEQMFMLLFVFSLNHQASASAPASAPRNEPEQASARPSVSEPLDIDSGQRRQVGGEHSFVATGGGSSQPGWLAGSEPVDSLRQPNKMSPAPASAGSGTTFVCHPDAPVSCVAADRKMRGQQRRRR
jgi:hypothetical protein